ncbi:hypothetical protein ACFLTZ_02565 [Chloroflexota bacterium]
MLRSTVTSNIYYWVREVEVIDIGRPYTVSTLMGEFKYWPALAGIYISPYHKRVI